MGLVIVFTAGAIDYQYEYENDPTPSLIKEVHNLKKLAALSKNKNAPILIEFSTPWCSYCEALEKEILEPLLKSAEYREQVIIRKIEVSDYNSLVDFAGLKHDSVNWALLMKVDFYPTLVFFNSEGREIGRRLVGITVLEFVADEIDHALAYSRKLQ